MDIATVSLKASHLMGGLICIICASQAEQSDVTLRLLDAGFTFSRYYSPGMFKMFPYIVIQPDGVFCNMSAPQIEADTIDATEFITANPR